MSAAEPRLRVADARLQLLFTPAVAEAAGRDPLAALDAALPFVDVVQVRPKELGGASGPCEARATYEWTRTVLDLAATRGSEAPLVIVDDRIDVAIALAGAGCAGCHVGQDDLPPTEARTLLGEKLVLGLSTHDAEQIAAAAAEDVDYLGFGPVFATGTKGYERGLGPELAWVAANASPFPVFAIGGVTTLNADDLVEVGRAAVGSAILAAEDPAAAAQSIAEALSA